MDQNPATVTTRKKARAIIEELARLRGTYTAAFRREAQEEARKGRPATLQLIEGNQELRENLAQALKAISKDLYTSQARFMMEVIQNADDNKYSDGETPTVCITVFPEHVKVECNEKGFSRENIQALCRTARSSKPPGQGYTGEKGIGFKSVFKLANRAHIRSPPYYFQLDQKRDLGMITPRWDEDFFDNFEEEHQTTIVLDHICGPLQNFSIALKKDFEAIDPVLVLFLRRIERLQLKLFKSSSDDKPLISKCFQRVDWTPDSGIVSLRDEDANTKRRFYKHRFTVDFKGTETRRPGMTKTDIVLAFPVKKTSDTYMPSIRKQNFAFAYLPLGDFGFKVYTLLHDTLQLPGFTGEDNWTSSLRSRAGFLPYSHREVSDLTYKDTHGALTRHFLQMQHPYTTPEWLSTACDHGNVPLYRLEVKSTTKQDPATTFYMSGAQHKLAKKLRVTSRRPSEVYAILRISGLDALEEGSGHRPQWRVYLDPYTRGEEGVLNFVAPTYAVTATV
ncbi:Nn.00g117490.m01.CDS01 [Neocucurbitaria sp. VM-36]